MPEISLGWDLGWFHLLIELHWHQATSRGVQSWVCTALIYHSSQHRSCGSESSLPLPVPWSRSEDKGSPGAGGWGLADLWLHCLLHEYFLHETHPSLLFCFDNHVRQTWAHRLCLCSRFHHIQRVHTCHTLLALLKLEDALKKGILPFVLLLWHDLMGSWAGSGWWDVANTGILVKAWKKGLFLSHCYFHARHCSLARRVRRYVLNSVKYAEAVDVYSPCRIIH